MLSRQKVVYLWLNWASLLFCLLGNNCLDQNEEGRKLDVSTKVVFKPLVVILIRGCFRLICSCSMGIVKFESMESQEDNI